MKFETISQSLLEDLADAFAFYSENAVSEQNKLYFQGKRDAYAHLLKILFEKDGVSA